MTTLLLDQSGLEAMGWRPGTEGAVVSRGAAMALDREQEDASEQDSVSCSRGRSIGH